MWERPHFDAAQLRKATGALKEVPNRITDEGIALLACFASLPLQITISTTRRLRRHSRSHKELIKVGSRSSQ